VCAFAITTTTAAV